MSTAFFKLDQPIIKTFILYISTMMVQKSSHGKFGTNENNV